MKKRLLSLKLLFIVMLCYLVKSYRSITVQKFSTISKQFSHEKLPSETIYILDGTSLLFHAFYSRQHNEGYKNIYLSKEYTIAYNKRNDNNIEDEDNNIACGALTVMAINFARFIRNVKPKYVAVAFDTNSNTFRRKLYPAYKAQREAPPPDLVPLFSIAPKLLETMGCRTFLQSGYEADDVMATLGRWSRERGLNVVHVSNDKDMLQLIDTGVHVMNPFTLDIQGPEEVIEKFGVPPESLIDLMTLMGDAADNIPGVKGIGPKIAAALIKHFGSVDNMYNKLGLSHMKKKNELIKETSECLEIVGNELKEDYILLEEVNELKPNNKKKKSIKIDKDLEHIDSKQLEEAFKHLEDCLQPIRATPSTILKKLLSCELDELTLFQHLFKLRVDVKLAGLQEVKSSRILNPIKDKYTDKTNIYPLDTIQQNYDDTEELSTFHFRYYGEKDGAEEEIRKMSESLLEPLELLRQQYHKLDRRH